MYMQCGRAHTYISTNPQLEELTRKVRAGLGDKQVFRKNKQTLLPYVTPAGIFSYCKEQCMQVPSGLFVIDIDELASTEESGNVAATASLPMKCCTPYFPLSAPETRE